MSQYYPQPSPFRPPEQNPEQDYYEEGEFEYEVEEGDDYVSSGDSWVERILIFLAGGCLVFLCMSCCGLLAAGLWVLDPGSGLVATPIPGADIGFTLDDPAYPYESVVNEQNVQLTILQVNRNAALPDVPPAEGQEIIIVTIELVNFGQEPVDFNERDFMLLNRYNEEYLPLSGVVDGALGRGSLPPDSGLEGRLAFEVAADEFELILMWESGPDSEPRYIYLE